MTKSNQKKKLKSERRKKNALLLIVSFLHACCIAMGAHLDLFRRSSYSFARASNVCYGIGISSGGCIGVSGLTIIGVVYKLIKKDQKDSYFKQIFDLTILIANLLMIIAFLGNFLIYRFGKIEGIYVPDTDNPNRVITLFNSGTIRTQTYFGFNIAISHLLVPLFLLHHFLKFSKVNLLKKKFLLTSISILINPSIGFTFVIFREKISNHGIHPNKISYDFPRNYPYVFFYRIMGQQAYEKDINYSHSLISRFLGTTGTVFVGCLTFCLLAYFLIRGKGKNEEQISIH